VKGRSQGSNPAADIVMAPMSVTAAELLHRLQQEAAEAVAPAPGTIVLAPRAKRCHYTSNDTSLSGLFDDFSTSVYLFRHHGNGSSRWTGEETLRDADGRKWERRIHAVVDNFGDLVEVPA
jgi:hypothetical protein